METNKTLNFDKVKSEAPTNLKKALEKANLPGSWAAQRLNISRHHANAVLKGRLKPSLELALEMEWLATDLEKIAS